MGAAAPAIGVVGLGHRGRRGGLRCVDGPWVQRCGWLAWMWTNDDALTLLISRSTGGSPKSRFVDAQAVRAIGLLRWTWRT